jgi:hypothetical protein
MWTGVPRRDYSKEEMFTEPNPSSDNESPDFEEEVFAIIRIRGIKPENLSGRERRDYQKWLKKEQCTGS